VRTKTRGRMRRFAAGMAGANHNDVERPFHGPLQSRLLADAEVLEDMSEQIVSGALS
jgi:hypothetical protein